MAQYVINTGSLPNDGTGTPLRTAFNDTNLNFNQIFAAGPVGSNIQISNNTIITTNVNGNLILATNGTGVIRAAAHIQPDQANLRMIGSGTNRFNTVYTQYLDTQSAAISGNLAVTGNLYVSGNTITANISTLNVVNATITVADGAPAPVYADGAGLLVGGNTNASFLYGASDNIWISSLSIQAPSFIGDGSQLTNVVANVSASGIAGNTLNANVLYSSLVQVGTLGNLSVSGNVSVGQTILSNTITTGEITAIAYFGNGAGLTNIIGSNVVGNVANATYATFAGTAGSANLAATATQALNAQNAVRALTAQSANTAQFADIANWANCADLATTAYQANSAVVAGRAETIDTQATITVTGNIVAGGILTNNYYFANGTPATFGGGTDYSNANVAAYLPTYSGDLDNLVNVTVAGSTSANTISAQGNIQGSAVYANGFFYGNGTPFTGAGFVLGDQQFYGNGSVGPYTMTQSSTNNAVIVTINGLTQTPGTTYTVAGNLITFSDGINVNELVDIRYLGTAAGGGANTGNIGFNGDTIYDLNGMTLNNGDLSHGSTSSVTIPVNGNIQTPLSIVNTYSNVLITAGNGTGNNSTWTFDSLGNLRLPTNTSSINYANGQPYGGSGSGNVDLTQVTTDIIPTGNNSQSLGNATNQWQDLWVSNATIYFNSVPLTLNAEDQLTIGNSTIVTTSGAGNTLSVTDLSVTGNVTAGFLYGNGAGLTNINAGNIVGAYGNANVAAYLPTDTTIIGIQNSISNTNSNVSNLSISVTGLTNSLANTNSNVANVASNVTTLQGQVYANANVAAYLPTYTGNISAGNIATTGQISIQGNVATQGIVSAVGNIVTDGYFVGNFAGNISGNIVVPGANTQVLFNTNGNVDAVGGLTYNKDSNVLAVLGSVTAQGNVYGNVFVGNGSQLTNLPVASTLANSTATFTLLADNTLLAGTVASPVNFVTNTATPDVDMRNASGTGTLTQGANLNIYATNSQAWTFDNTGNLTFPDDSIYGGDTFTSPESTGILNNFKWDFSDATAGADTVTLQWNLLDTTLDQWYLTTGGQTKTWTLDSATQQLSFGNVGDPAVSAVTFGTAANSGVGNVNDIELTSTNSNVYVRANNNSWMFDNTGNLTTPGNIKVTASHGNLVFGDATATGSPGLSSTTSVTITANRLGTPKELTLTTTGNLAVPGNISTSSNVSANYFIGNGSQLTGITATANTGNLEITGTLIEIAAGATETSIVISPSGPTGGQAFVDVPDNATANTANLRIYNSLGNIELGTNSGSSSWYFDNTGNIMLPTNGAVNFAGGGIKQTLNEDFYIRASDDEPDGWSIYNVVDDGAGNDLAQTRLEYNQYSVRTNIQGASPYTWVFRESGDLELPNNLIGNVGNSLTIKIGDQVGSDTFIDLQTRSYIGDALISNIRIANPDVTISTASAAYNWTFDDTGNLALPRGGVVYETGIPFGGLEGNTIALKPSGGTNADQQLLVYPTAGADFNHLHLTTGNLWNTEMFLGNDDFYVKLANTGNIVINTNDNVGNTAQWTFGTEGTILNSGNLTLQTPNGVPGAVTAITASSGSWEANPVTNLATTGGTGTGLTVNVIQEGGYAGTITIATPGTGYTNGDAISVVSGSSSASFTISVLANGWTFGTTGNLTLPGNTSSINYANGSPYAAAPANTGNVTFVDTTIQGVNGLQLSAGPDFTANTAYLQVRAGDQPSHIHLDTGDNSTYDLLVGDDNKYVQIGLAGNISIASYAGNATQSIWNFDTAGNLVLPTISLGSGIDEQTVIQSQRKLIPPFRWSAEITADTPTVVYTATDVNTTSMKVTMQVQHQGLGFELFEVFATFAGSTDTYYVVNNRVAPPTIDPTTVEVSLTGSNVMQITLTVNSGVGSSWVTYDAVEFGIPND